MKRVAVVSKNKYLLRKIELTLLPYARVTLSGSLPDGHFDVLLWDCDSMGEAPALENLITVSRGSGDIKIPFEFKTLIDAVTLAESRAQLVCRGRFAYLRDEKIKLTELEAALLTRLISAGGEFVSRSDILRDVWGDGAEDGIINVYIHYLREKLEMYEKIIISSRSKGYKIDRRYL